MDRTRENNAEDAMPGSARTMGEAAASAAQKVTESLDQGREALAEIQAVVSERTRECVEATDNYVRENPWQAVGMAAGAGLILGLLMSRR